MPHSDTVAVHAGEPTLDRKDAPVTPDISVGSASGYPDLQSLDAAMAAHRGYGRWGTDNHRQLEAAVAGLEANGLATKLEAVAVGSGMAAIAVALMSEMNAGDHVVAAHDCYGTTVTFLRNDLPRFGITPCPCSRRRFVSCVTARCHLIFTSGWPGDAIKSRSLL